MLEAYAIPLLFAAFIGFLIFQLRRSLRRARGVKRPGPIEIPPETIADHKGPVWCCMECGSPTVGGGGVQLGMIPGAGDHFAFVCRRCGHRGPALEFDDATAFRQFVKGLHADDDDETSP